MTELPLMVLDGDRRMVGGQLPDAVLVATSALRPTRTGPVLHTNTPTGAVAGDLRVAAGTMEEVI